MPPLSSFLLFRSQCADLSCPAFGIDVVLADKRRSPFNTYLSSPSGSQIISSG